MKKKIIIVLVVLLAGGGFVAKSMFLKPAVAKEKIAGTIYILPKSFTANLKDGRYATLTVALVLAPSQSTGAAAGGGRQPLADFGGRSRVCLGGAPISVGCAQGRRGTVCPSGFGVARPGFAHVDKSLARAR